MIFYVLLFLILATVAIVGWSLFAQRRQRSRRARRYERNLEDQRLWEATIAARTAATEDAKV